MEEGKSNLPLARPGYQTADAFRYRYLKPFQRSLRKDLTRAEEALWKELQNKKTGFKFRRQHIIANYIVDFVCLRQKLIVEVDGEIHLKQLEQDLIRTQVLAVKGYHVIRFTNEEVLNNAAGIATKIKLFIESNPIQ